MLATVALLTVCACGPSADTVGDTVAVSVIFSATGGRISSDGLYTAGPSAGSYRVIATSNGLADTSTVTLTARTPRPTAAPSDSGLSFGTYHLPIDSIGRPGIPYNAALYTVSTGNLKRQLETARSRGGRLLLAVPRFKSKDPRGRLSARVVGDELARWKAAVDLAPYIGDGTVAGIYLTDEPQCASCWGGTTANQTQVDSMAMFSKRLWPTAITFARVEPTWFKSPPKYLDVAWAQYDGPYRDGTPERYRDEMIAAAKALGLKLVLWMNVLDGGCGPTGQCLPGVPGTDIWGTFPDAPRVRRWQMSAAEVLYYGKVFLGDGRIATPTCLAIHWQWGPAFNARSGRTSEQLAGIRAFDNRADVKDAMAQLASIAAARPAPNCLVH